MGPAQPEKHDFPLCTPMVKVDYLDPALIFLSELVLLLILWPGHDSIALASSTQFACTEVQKLIYPHMITC